MSTLISENNRPVFIRRLFSQYISSRPGFDQLAIYVEFGTGTFFEIMKYNLLLWEIAACPMQTLVSNKWFCVGYGIVWVSVAKHYREGERGSALHCGLCSHFDFDSLINSPVCFCLLFFQSLLCGGGVIPFGGGATPCGSSSCVLCNLLCGVVMLPKSRLHPSSCVHYLNRSRCSFTHQTSNTDG